MKHPSNRAEGATLAAWLEQTGAAQVLSGLANVVNEAAVFAVDADRNVVLWSEGAERLLGFGAEEVLGQHCLKANRCEHCMVGCGIAEHGRVDRMLLRLYNAKGELVRARKTAQAFFGPDGSFLGGVEALFPVVETEAHESQVRLPESAVTFHGMTSRDPAMLRIFDTCRNVAESSANVLVRGESGTGKELVARAMHAGGTRSAGPFVAVNCASLTPTLMESELFGHVKGAFTGAVVERRGIFEQAHGGTLFLDEVAELPLELQAKLLRVLEQREVTRVGGATPIAVDVRIVAATHRSLRQAVKAGRFREDLMYRLRVVPIFLPPLRERRSDVGILLSRFIGEHNLSGPRVVDSVAPEAMRLLLDHPWPGNVRELRNGVEYAFAVGRGPEIRLEHLPPDLRPSAHAVDRASSPSDEASRIRDALRRSDGHIGRAAALLGMSRPTLWRKRKKLGM